MTLELKAGGAQRLVLEEARHFEKRGHDVILIPAKDNQEFRDSVGMKNIKVREYPFLQLNTPSAINKPFEIKRLRKILLNEDLDLVISHYHDIDVYLATRGTNINFSCHINGSPFWFISSESIIPHRGKSGYKMINDTINGHREFISPDSFPAYKKRYHEVRESLRERALQQSTVVTTLTSQVASELNFCYKIDPEVVRPGVGEEWHKININATPRDLKNVATDYAICNVGRLDERKRNALLIRAFSKIAKERDDITLIIGGTGNQGKALRALVSRLEIDERVVFPGYISEEKLPKYYAACDILAHPAWVAYGLTPLEAYVLGTKVAISTDTMVKEIIAGEPGVEILAPNVSDWESGLRELLDAPDHAPNTSVVPTWAQYFDDKYEILVGKDVL